MNLQIGTKIKIGVKYEAKHGGGFKPNEVIELVEGSFEEYNGLYDVTTKAPAIWNDYQNEFDSIYHLFGNDLENFMDCKIV